MLAGYVMSCAALQARRSLPRNHLRYSVYFLVQQFLVMSKLVSSCEGSHVSACAACLFVREVESSIHLWGMPCLTCVVSATLLVGRVNGHLATRMGPIL